MRERMTRDTEYEYWEEKARQERAHEFFTGVAILLFLVGAVCVIGSIIYHTRVAL